MPSALTALDVCGDTVAMSDHVDSARLSIAASDLAQDTYGIRAMPRARRDAVFVDVGANVGTQTLCVAIWNQVGAARSWRSRWWMRDVAEGGSWRIIAVEPSPPTFLDLLANINAAGFG